MMSTFWSFLLFVTAVMSHVCIHDKMSKVDEEQEAAWQAENRKRMVLAEDVDIPSEYRPIRIKLDYTYLAADADPYGLCIKPGDWARIGDPPAGSEETHVPNCGTDCDGGSGDCSCWYQCTAEDVFYKQKRDELVDQLFPKAVKRLEESLMVLRTPISIGSRDRCGCSKTQVPITDAIREKYTDYTEHDLVLFVTAHSTRVLSGETLAYACSCESNFLGRPVFGHINWGSNKIDFRDGERIDLQIGVAVHEMTHALGFAGQKYSAFLDESKVLKGTKVTLKDYQYPRQKMEDIIKTKAYSITGVNGELVKKTVKYIATPLVTEATQRHFDCNNEFMVGAELEDAGSSGTEGSHWEKRLFNNEYMTGSSSYDPIYSDITLSLLQDTGWYKANMSNATPFLFGKGEGCNFARPRCDLWSGPYKCDADQESHWGCTFDGNARGICSVATYNNPLPDWNQYFKGKPNVGGGKLADFCPFFAYSSNLKTDCRNPEFQADNLAIRGEHFSPSARCLDSTLLSKGKQGLKGSGGCFSLRCVGGKLFARIADEFRDCSKPNDEITASGYNGRVKCPPKARADELCRVVPNVDALPTLTSVEPKSGGEPTVGMRFDVTGTGLSNTVRIKVGTYFCTKLIGKPTSSTVSCEIEEPPKSKNDDGAPTPSPTTEEGTRIETISNIFVEKTSPDVQYDVVAELSDGLTAFLPQGYSVSGASHYVLSLGAVVAAVALL